MVLAGAWVNLYICIAVPSSLTVIYVEFIYHFGSSKAMAGLVVSLCAGMRGCAGESYLSTSTHSHYKQKQTTVFFSVSFHFLSLKKKKKKNFLSEQSEKHWFLFQMLFELLSSSLLFWSFRFFIWYAFQLFFWNILNLLSHKYGLGLIYSYLGTVIVIWVNWDGGARGVIVIIVGNEHGDTSSNPGRDWLHFT